MQIIIPMSGIGKRFIDAGYTDPKPLIKVDGIPIIEHVVNMFPDESNFTFICNKEHIETTDMRKELKRIAPQGTIIEIPPHKKGPVYAVTLISDIINDDEEVIVNYCDFSCYWDYEDFLRHTRGRNADGAIPAYKGYHPHMLGPTNYAFMRDHEQWMLEIKEKEPFTNNRMNEYASTGTYYFKKGSIVKYYFKKLIEEEHNLNGEYYVSLVYNLLKKDQMKISIYEIQHMLQWGTPQDLQEYEAWSNYFRDAVNPKENYILEKESYNLIPLAGAGSRFTKENYLDPKPLINVSGKPMIIQAAKGLPASANHMFICLAEHLGKYPLEEELIKEYPEATIVTIEELTEGQACTCEVGAKLIDPEAPLLIGACDNGMVWNMKKYQELISDPQVDAIAFSFKHHVSSLRNPQMYGWIDVDDNDFIKKVSVKVPISDNPFDDHAVVGTFYFKKAKYFLDALQNLYSKNIRVNNEYYVDSCINEVIANGLRAKVFKLDHYVCWGTPNDLRTYQYWQSFFNKWSWHEYSIKNDHNVDKKKAQRLSNKSYAFKQRYE